MNRLVIENGQIVTPHEIFKADILIEGEKIAGIFSHGVLKDIEAQKIDATDCLVLAGLIDPHTHIQLDTGIYKTADTWEIGTKTAVYGGITTVIDFATQYQGMNFSQALEHRLKECAPAYIDYGLHMMVTEPIGRQDKYANALEELMKLGVQSIKLFTTYRPNYYLDDPAILRTFEAMPWGMVAMVHCENDAIVTDATQRLTKSKKVGWEYHREARPMIAELEAVQRMIQFGKSKEIPLYIVHCSNFESVKLIYENNYGYVFCETCPQYFTMNDEVYQSKSPERYILQPPLRNFDQQGTLEFYLNSPMIHVIATDHCDYTLAQKKTVNNFTKTPGGLPGLETSLQITFSQLYGQMGIAAMCIVTQKMSETPAKIFGLYPRKGTLQIGSDADIVIYDPRPTKTITQKDLHNIAGYTPYEGLKAKGYVRTTISRGKILVHDGKFLGEVGRGQFLAGDEILSELTSQMNPKWIRELKNSSKEMPFNIFMAGHDDDKDDDYFGLHDEY